MNAARHNNKLYAVVTSHYLIAALCFLVLALMCLFSEDAFSGHYFQPRILALTHIAALGWGSIIIFGALYQLLPVIMETELYSTNWCWYSLAFFTTGLSLLALNFWIFETGWPMQLGGLFVLIGVLFFGWNVMLTISWAKSGSIHKMFILTACFWLISTASMGLLLVFNLRYAFLPADHLHFLRLHAHMGITGWFLLLIIGVSTRLIPMFLVSRYENNRLLLSAYYLINAALVLFLINGYYHGLNLSTYLIAALGVTGVVFYLVFVYQCFQSRLRKAIDLPMLKTLLSFVFLVLAIVILPFILYAHLHQDPSAARLTLLYGILLFMGWITSLILGQTFKTLPFIVWLKHYEHLTGKVKTPMPADLLNKWLLRLQSFAFLVFAVSFTSGILLSASDFIRIGTWSLTITALAYCLQIVRLLLHRTKTQEYDRL